MKKLLIVVPVILSGCVVYPDPAYSGGPDPYRAQTLANEQCAKSGRVAVMVSPKNCDATNCTTTFECR
ncbi:MAG: hypothetical protein KA223_07790 [Candidatus Accumulibacter sp.]|nr:hypothetical protein [Accumulibacter sp.]